MTPSTARRTTKKKKDAKPESTRPFIAHHLAPPHEVLSEDESQKVLVGLGTTADKLPKILLSDPGLQTDPKFVPMRDAGDILVGRLVRIHRPSQTAGQALAYRVIVPTLGSS
jgi:DNA-directed RNA polymerase subunit H (RpoH/RPB5)